MPDLKVFLSGFLIAAVVATTSMARAEGVKAYDFDADVIEGERAPARTSGPEPEAWAHVKKGEHGAARTAFAAAIAKAKDPAQREPLVEAWLDASVLEGTEPARIESGLDAFHPTPEERARWRTRIVERYERYGDLEHARVARSKLAREAHAGAEAAKLHLAAAADAHRELDWRTLDTELGAAAKAAGEDAAVRDEVAKAIFGYATELQETYKTSRDRAVAVAARTLYTRYLALPGVDAAQARDLSRQLDEDLAASAPSRRPSAVGTATVQGSLDKATLRRFIRAHQNEVTGCYQRSLIADETVAGKLNLELHISRGVVTHASIADAPGPLAAVAACISARAKKWRFPATPGMSIQLVYPLELRVAGR